MATGRFSGVFPALVTPFDEAGNIDTRALHRLVRWNLEKGVSGFYVCGSTGESYLLSIEERQKALETVVSSAHGQVPVLAHIGCFSTRDSLNLARHADSLGVAAVSSVPPFYFKFTLSEYTEYYDELAEAITAPLIVYNVPAMSGVAFSGADLARFLAKDRIAGLKHTSFDLFQLQRLVEDFPGKTVFIGHDEIYLSGLAAGSTAAVGSTFNFMAEQFIAIESHFRRGEIAEAQKLQGKVNKIIEVLVSIGVFKGVKAALQLLGQPCGQCRKPFQSLSQAELEALKGALRLL